MSSVSVSKDLLGNVKSADPVCISENLKIPLLDYNKIVKASTSYFSSSRQQSNGVMGVLARDIYLYFVLNVLSTDRGYWHAIICESPKRREDLELRSSIANFLFATYDFPVSRSKTILRDIGKQKRKYVVEKNQRNRGEHICGKCSKKFKTRTLRFRHEHQCKRSISKELSALRKSMRNEKKMKGSKEAKKAKEAKTKRQGNYAGLTLKCINEKGTGLFANRTYRTGDLVCDYGGEIIQGKKEIQALHARYSQLNETGGYMYEFKFRGIHYCIDATNSSSLGRYSNHSRKNPNCYMAVECENGSQVPRLFLRAKRTISRCEEILHDYGERSKEAIRNFEWLKL